MNPYNDPNNDNLERVIAEIQGRIQETDRQLAFTKEVLLCIALSDDPVERFALYTKFVKDDWTLQQSMNDITNNKVPDMVRQFHKMQLL